MSAGAIVFMLLTMGGVVGLGILCVATWLRPARAPGKDEASEGGSEPGSPAS